MVSGNDMPVKIHLEIKYSSRLFCNDCIPWFELLIILLNFIPILCCLGQFPVVRENVIFLGGKLVIL